jgi:hypothetical protein
MSTFQLLVDRRFGDLGIKLYMRLTRSQRLEYNTLMVKSEIHPMTARAIDAVFCITDLSKPPIAAGQEHWIASEEHLEAARDILIEGMNDLEKHLSQASLISAHFGDERPGINEARADQK